MKLIKVLTKEKDELLKSIYEIKTDYKGKNGEFAGSTVFKKEDEVDVKYAIEHLNEIEHFIDRYYMLGFFEEHGESFKCVPYGIEKISIFYYDENGKKYQVKVVD